MFTKLKHCPLCQSENSTPEMIIEDLAFSRESFSLNKCKDCDFLYTNPVPSDPSRYYSTDNYISHQTSFTSITDIVYSLVRNFSFHYKYRLISDGDSASNLLDIGCGTGQFLKYMQKKNWDIGGVEKSESPRLQAERVLSKTIQEDIFQITAKYEVVTLWHVLEHLPNLNATVAHLKTLLNANGHIYFALPNYKSLDAKEYKEYWAGYDVPRHLYHFDQSTFHKLMSRNGMKIVSTHPLYFDSFYVSLLSEKYLGNSGLSALYNSAKKGIKSNKAAKIDMEYSSLIYKCRKK